MAETPEVYVNATEYTVSALPEDHPDRFRYLIKVTYRPGGYWAVTDGWQHYRADGTHMWPKSDEDAAAVRHELLDALALARKVAPKLVINVRTAVEALTRRRCPDGT